MSKLFEQLVKMRGLDAEFLAPKYEDLSDPFLLPDMGVAVERIILAAERGEKVLIYGDYDVDGVTSSTVMEEVLRLAGVKEVEIMLPDRFADGYGMSPKVVKRAKEMGAGLVVTVDCGSGNKEIVEELNTLGIDTIVTDHHECPEVLPEAVAVVNPKRKEYAGFRDLAGVGVAFMVGMGLVKKGKIPAGREKWLLDLVIIGTICDSMPLVRDNRIFGVYGMKVLGKTRRAGLLELMKNAGVKEINSDAIGFQIGPRLNAAGRLSSAELSLNLLRAKTRVEAAKLAAELEEFNDQRKTEQRTATTEIMKRRGEGGDEKVIVETGNWHEGVVGIIAGRLVEEYKRPAFVLTEVAEGVFKGSGRSFGDFSLAVALDYCRGSIISGGGHAGACGVRVMREKIWEFREKMNEYYLSLGLSGQEKFLGETAEIETGEIGGFSLELVKDLKILEPFGEGNQEPIWRLKNVKVVEMRHMGAEGKHLRFEVEGTDGKTLKLVAFFAKDKWFKVSLGERRDFLIKILENEWNGMRSVEGRVVEIVV